jgi:hypothetical protein
MPADNHQGHGGGVMSRLTAAVSGIVAQLKSHDSRLDDLTARVDALEARLIQTTTSGRDTGRGPARDEAALALAEYQRQLDEDAFQPEGKDVTSAMRAERRAAVDAADRAASWLRKSGRNRDKEIYAAIGAGRKALIRLTALREHRPVPMPLLTAAELSGYVDVAADVHTEERFRWEGAGDAEILIDRPVFGKPVLVEFAAVGRRFHELHITQVQRTDRILGDRGTTELWGPRMVFREMVGPEITHLRITAKSSWRLRVVPFDELPPLADETTGRGEACFRHTLGDRTVTIQGTVRGAVEFVPDCDCADVCAVYRHKSFDAIGHTGHGDFREDLTLPRENGMLYMKVDDGSLWSITVLDNGL